MIKEIVEDRLYVGDVEAGQNREYLEEKGFDIIVNLMQKSFYDENWDGERPVFLHAPLEDGPDNDIGDIDYAVRVAGMGYVLGSASDDPAKVLVHCAAGISRSPAVAAAVVSVRDTKGLEHGLEHVKEKHDGVNIEPGLRDGVERVVNRIISSRMDLFERYGIGDEDE